MSPLKRCRCGTLHPAGQTHCPPRNTASRPSLNTYAWQKRRAQIRRRDKVCQGCGSTSRLSVHHKRKATHGGTDQPANLVLLCPTCHTRAEAAA